MKVLVAFPGALPRVRLVLRRQAVLLVVRHHGLAGLPRHARAEGPVGAEPYGLVQGRGAALLQALGRAEQEGRIVS